jgi:hypothetical protein
LDTSRCRLAESTARTENDYTSVYRQARLLPSDASAFSDGADGIGTGFGDSSTGIVDGPGQASLDVALSKTVSLRSLSERSRLEFRAEFFNALNHPRFANPDSNFTSPTFGVIASTAVNPRVGQLALRLAF